MAIAPQIAPLTGGSAKIAEKASAYGIYDSAGKLAINPDSIFDFEERKEYRIPNYPIEGGKLESYNKVETPDMQHVTLVKAGKTADRSAFMKALDNLIASRELYKIVTPEITYLNVNLIGRTYRKMPDNGAQILNVVLDFQEVRLGIKPKFTKSQSPATANTQNGGNVTPTPIPPNQTPKQKPQ